MATSLIPSPSPLAPSSAPPPICTLVHNDSGRFVDRWVRLLPQPGKCIWTRGIAPLDLPIAHGEGKFVPGDDVVRRTLWERGQVALVYGTASDTPAGIGSPENPNGSTDGIAGICDSTGLVFGLMPHPERFIDPQQHPAWSRQPALEEAAGLAIFRNAVTRVGG